MTDKPLTSRQILARAKKARERMFADQGSWRIETRAKFVTMGLEGLAGIFRAKKSMSERSIIHLNAFVLEGESILRIMEHLG